MTFRSFQLELSLYAQHNGTLVATCKSLPILAAGHDAESLGDQLVKVLRNLVNRVEAMDPADADYYLTAHGIASTTRTMSLVSRDGFDEKRLRARISEWATAGNGTFMLEVAA